LAVLCLNLVAFWWGLPRAGAWLSAIFYLWAKLYAVLLPSQFWLLADELLDPRQAKRLFGPVGAGGILGSISGSATAGFLAQPLGTGNLLLVALGGLLAGLAMLQVIIWRRPERSLRDPGLTPGLSSGPIEAHSPGEGVGEPKWERSARGAEGPGQKDLGGSRPLLILIAALLTLAITVHTIIDWQFNKAAVVQITDLDARTAFFGQFFTLLNIITLGIQLLATSFVLRYLGIGVALLLLPAAMATGSIGILLHPGLWSAALARGADDAFRFSIDQSARELLFLPIPSAARVKLKPSIDLMASRAANGIGGLVILAGVWLLDDPISALSLFCLTLTAAWAVMALRARKRYADTLQHLLKVRDVDVAYLARSRLDADARAAIRAGLASADPATVRAALGLAAHTDPGEFVAELHRILRTSENPNLKSRVLRLLTESGDHDALDDALKNLDQPDRELTAEALAYACAAGGAKTDLQIDEYLRGKDPLLAVAAAVCLLEQPDPEQQQSGVRILERAASIQEGELAVHVRISVADIIRARPGIEGLREILTGLLDDEIPDVVRAALATAARHQDVVLVRSICQVGLRRALRTSALQTLLTFGDKAAGALTGILADPRNSRELRQLAARALSRLGGTVAAEALSAGLSADDRAVRWAALKALNHMRRRGQPVDIGHHGEKAVIGMEWKEYLSLHRLAATLQRPGTDSPSAFVAKVVEERLEDAQERLFRALALRHPTQTIFFAYRGLMTGDPAARANAIELIDSTLEGSLRLPLVRLLEEDNPTRRGRIAADELGLTPASEGEALRELINPADPWLAACALAAMESTLSPLPRGLLLDLAACDCPALLELLEEPTG
ncbi:MAG: hypothetical protein ACE5HV_09175, partial [Acidobacteriota bacterium]